MGRREIEYGKIEQAAALPADASRMAMVNRVESFQGCSRAKNSGLSSKSRRLTYIKGVSPCSRQSCLRFARRRHSTNGAR
jgi:hypothetical protein